MPTIEYDGIVFQVDENGFLMPECAFGTDFWAKNGDKWMDYSKEFEGITELTDGHKKVIDTLQEYYKKNGIAPMVRVLCKNLGLNLGEIYILFPSGPRNGVCKMGGVDPLGCV